MELDFYKELRRLMVEEQLTYRQAREELDRIFWLYVQTCEDDNA